MKTKFLIVFSITLLVSSSIVNGQSSEVQEWKKYINVGFEFLMPNEANKKVFIGSKGSVLEQVLPDTDLYYLNKYQGESLGFRTTIEVIAYEAIDVTSISKKIMEMMKNQFANVPQFELVSHSNTTVKQQRKLEAVYKGPRGYINTIIWLGDHRAITIGIEDYSSDSELMKYFSENFILY